ncbi:DDE superfamily endonuclease [Popillia japonica]|uniref:DDE superfamily endonuclease n=1 Tax=Popillia japonica TaxID=7064 RepID=A0AAW1MW53_POPJA
MLGSEMGQRSAMPMGTYIRRAAKELGFNEAAVGKRLKKGYGTQKLSRFRSVFSNQEEIVSLSEELNKTSYGILFKSLRFLLFHYAESNNIPSPFNKDKMAAGKDFAIAVMRRHKLTLCTPTKISIARTMGFNRVQIGHFFENLKEAYEKYGFTSDRIFNVDEVSRQHQESFPKLYQTLGKKKSQRTVAISSHTTLEAVAHAKSNNVVMLSLPPHSSHKTQPLDRVFFKPLKSNYDQVADNWQSSHPGQTITVYDVAELFKTAYERTATLEKAIVLFRVTGIYPLDSTVFSEENFLPSEVTEQNLDDIGEEHTLMVTFLGDDEPTANPEPSHVDQFSDDLIKEPLAILEPGLRQEPSTIPGSIRHPTSPISSITVANVSTVSAADIMPLPKLAKKGNVQRED